MLWLLCAGSGCTAPRCSSGTSVQGLVHEEGACALRACAAATSLRTRCSRSAATSAGMAEGGASVLVLPAWLC